MLGSIGPPQPTVFSRIGPNTIVFCIALLLAALLGFGRRETRT
jgi:ABC-type transport system involved in cytochrome c biogenesis permease component